MKITLSTEELKLIVENEMKSRISNSNDYKVEFERGKNKGEVRAIIEIVEQKKES